MHFKRLFAGAAAAALVSAVMATSAAAAVISNGMYSVGVSEYGQLYDAATGTGFTNGSHDYLTNGGIRDGWGVNGAFADDLFDGISGVALVDFDDGVSGVSALSLTKTSQFEISQAFSFAADNVLAIETTLTNITGSELSGTFLRIADFHVDMGPDYPDGSVESAMLFGDLFENTNYGYWSADTTQTWLDPCCDLSEWDLGAGLRVNFANLGAGKAFKFTYYYAFSLEGGVEDDLLGAGAQGGIVLEDADGWAEGGMGVSIDTPVPEPSTWALMIGGFGLAGAALRRRRFAHA